MPLDQNDLKSIKGAVEEVVEEKVPRIVEGVVSPYFNAIQKDFTQVNDRLDKIEKFLLEDHRRRIEKLEEKVQKLEDLLAIK